MKWAFWIEQYIGVHCLARGIMPLSMAAYRETLNQFREFVRFRLADPEPDKLTARQVLEYVEHLRRERNNGDAAVNRQVTILRTFYRAMVAMGYLESAANPLAFFPKIKAAPKKLPVFLDEEEVKRLLAAPRADTVMGLRDRALLALLYATGIRASECGGLRGKDVDLSLPAVRVRGKGGRERCVPLNKEVVELLVRYAQVRGEAAPGTPFFRSRRGRAMSRSAIFERVRLYGKKARIAKTLSPHRLRHTFATHLVKAGVALVTIRDLLGHRCITSTQVYLHTTAEDLRQAAALHPVERLIGRIEEFLPGERIPFQWPPGERRAVGC